mmetsp:Transcript_43245/g.83017  ORF Transcript_43245/g.83017 Transcript_43245/m.83017 type:complete len:420 (+) Transcript_43245:99-1358(+)
MEGSTDDRPRASEAGLLSNAARNGEQRRSARLSRPQPLEIDRNSCVNKPVRLKPRLLDRAAPFDQSMGRLKLTRTDSTGILRKIRGGDLFHTLVGLSTLKLLTLAAVGEVISWCIFAGLFWMVSDDCDLHINGPAGALFLAIETIATIGYGVEDPYMKGCYSGLLVLGAAALWESLLSALLFTLVYQRFSRAQVRATSVCFSQRAVISEIQGNCYFMFQVCDFRKHQLCEAHVRLYCVQHADTDCGMSFQTRAMRLQHPDDELGGMLLLALPQQVVHRIDAWSPLCPPSHRSCPGSSPATGFGCDFEVLQRACDAENGNREPASAAARPPAPGLQDVAKYLDEAQLEVLCLVEGIEPSTSGTLQARHSYTSDDVAHNASFKRCVSRSQDGGCKVNFDAFHELVLAEEEAMAIVRMQSMP